MSIEGLNLSLSPTSGQFGNQVAGLLAEAGNSPIFSSTLMAQLTQLQTQLLQNGGAGLAAPTGSPDLQQFNGLTGNGSGQSLQNFAALFGTKLPVVSAGQPSVGDSGINLDDTLQALSDVMQHLQSLKTEGGTEPLLPSTAVTQVQPRTAVAQTPVGTELPKAAPATPLSNDKPVSSESVSPEIISPQPTQSSQSLPVAPVQPTLTEPVSAYVQSSIEKTTPVVSSQSTKQTSKPVVVDTQSRVQQTQQESLPVEQEESVEQTQAPVLNPSPLTPIVTASSEKEVRLSGDVRSKSAAKTSAHNQGDSDVSQADSAVPDVLQQAVLAQMPTSTATVKAEELSTAPMATSLVSSSQQPIPKRNIVTPQAKEQPATATATQGQEDSALSLQALKDEFRQVMGITDSAASDRSSNNSPSLESALAVAKGQLASAPVADGSAFSKMTTDIAQMNQSAAVGSSDNSSDALAMSKPLNNPEWNTELGEKVLWMHKQAIPSAQIKINPEHLGPISIKIDVDQDQTTVSFTAHNAAVKESIEAALPKLREMLGGQNLNLVDVNVSQQQSEQRSARDAFQMAGEQQRGNNARQADGQATLVDDASANILDEIEAGRAIASNGLLSLFA